MSATISAYEIPLIAGPQSLQIELGGTTYNLRLYYGDSLDANGNGVPCGWLLDISDEYSNPLVLAIPLVTGCDLLGQYTYLGFNGTLMVYTAGDPAAPPTFVNLGSNSNLYYVLAVSS